VALVVADRFVSACLVRQSQPAQPVAIAAIVDVRIRDHAAKGAAQCLVFLAERLDRVATPRDAQRQHKHKAN
jgi:hypothetical protein